MVENWPKWWKNGRNSQKMAKKLLKWPMWPINGKNEGKMAETATKWPKL